MALDHSRCAHPRTPKGRAACRKAGGPSSSFTTNVAANLTLADPTEQHLDAVRRMARNLMDAHGLTGWTFHWDRSTRRYGECRHGWRQIGISRALAAVNDIARTRDTVLHEIAHAVVGPGYGHGPVWKAMAVRIGATPKACYDADTTTPAPGGWIGTCPNGHTARYRRMTWRIRSKSCGRCNPVWDARYMYTWKRF